MKFYNKNELKDSRIFFDNKPPIFMTMFIISLAFILVCAIFVSSVLVKPYIVKAQGIVNNTDTQYVSINVNGALVELHVQEGETVTKDQPLMTISNGQENLQIQALQAQLEQAQSKLEIMDRYQISLKNQTNKMKNEGLEQEYYGYVEYYLSQIKSENYSNVNLQKNYDEKQAQINTLNNEIVNLESKQKDLENVLNSNEISEEDKMLKQSELASTKQEIESKKSEKTSAETELDQLREQLNNPTSQSNQMYSQFIMELGKSRTTIETQITEIQGNLMVYSGQIDTYTINAENDGIIHYLSPITLGMSLQQNQVVAEISTQNEEMFIVEAYVNATDIAKISIGDKVNVAIAGVNSNKYGTIQGKLAFIDSGTISQETTEGNALLYRVKIEIQESILTSKNDEIYLIKSMPVEARIVYEEVTYFEWILELLNFMN